MRIETNALLTQILLHMKNFTQFGRFFYGIGVACIGVQQFIYADFRPVIIPAWPAWLHSSPIYAYIFGAILFVTGILIFVRKKIKTISLFLGGLFLILFIVLQAPFVLFVDIYSPKHLGLWTNPLKELAFSGGAFIIAGSFSNGRFHREYKNKLFHFLEKLIPLGRIFFSVMLIAFGLDHFYYADGVATLVPSWIPWHLLWTYFAAIALIGAGVAIILKIKIKLVATLVGIMIFLWLIVLHIPRAIADPYLDNGNEVTSVFEALAFSGIAFVIADKNKKHRQHKNKYS